MTPTFTCNMQQQQQIASSSILMTVLILLMINVGCLQAQLSSTTFYDSTCPNALSTIRTSIRQAVSRERRMAASLVRLHFHDCFVQGCDASILLADTPSFTGERTALQNNNSARGFEVIEAAKSAVESICPGVVSCSDILAVAARDASEAVGGPTWSVNLGRRDSTTASLSLANSNLPRFTDPLATLISNFGNKGLSQRDLVALSGAHTIGQARCVTFRARIYSNGSDIDAGFASTRRRQCPQTDGNANLAPLDLVTPNSFDNNYFRNVVQQRGLLQSDQILLTGSTETIVREYSNNRSTFSSDFAAAMLRMGNIDPLTGQDGIIRTTCAAATAN